MDGWGVVEEHRDAYVRWGGADESCGGLNERLVVTFLSVQVPAPTAIGVLDTCRNEISGQLEQIPPGQYLADVTAERFDSLLGPGSAWFLIPPAWGASA